MLEKEWKKLSYYTYKLMVEKIECSDLDNIQTIQKSYYTYIYKFTKQGEFVWTAWLSYFDDPGYVSGGLMELSQLSSAKAPYSLRSYPLLQLKKKPSALVLNCIRISRILSIP